MQSLNYDLYLKYLDAVSKYIQKYDPEQIGNIYLGGSGYGFLMGYHDNIPNDLDLQYTNGFAFRYSLTQVDQMTRGSIVITLPTTQATSVIKLAHPVDQYVRVFESNPCIGTKFEKWINWYFEYLTIEEQQAILNRLDDNNENKKYILVKAEEK